MSQQGVQIHARAILGSEGVANNASGELSIQGNDLLFKTNNSAITRIPLASIRDVFLTQQDKEVGGTSMAVSRAATPFGGGRVIGLFAHKKYGFLTLQYVDSNGGVHGAIYQLNKDQAQAFGKELEAKGLHLSDAKVDPANQRGTEANNETK
jgi:hypothetical protein